jgi:hypothetical protein
MPKYNVLHVVEYESDNINKSDSRLIIVYDTNEDKYYYYGTRSRSIGVKYALVDNYVQFSGAYSQLKDLVSLLKFMSDNFKNRFTSEMHFIDISDDELDDLNFEKLLFKLSRKSEIFAYDKLVETPDSIVEKLNILRSELV